MAKSSEWVYLCDVKSSKDHTAYRIDRRVGSSELRCRCKAYIFSGKGGAVRGCKHLVHVRSTSFTLSDLGRIVALPPPPAKKNPPYLQEAGRMFDAMFASAGLNGPGHYLNSANQTRLIVALAKQLAAFKPIPVVVAFKPVPPTVDDGVRLITFEEE